MVGTTSLTNRATRVSDRVSGVTRLFGTDGVRGVANTDLTAELALDLSVAAAHILGEAGAFGGRRPLAVVGRDPRASGEFLEADPGFRYGKWVNEK